MTLWHIPQIIRNSVKCSKKLECLAFRFHCLNDLINNAIEGTMAEVRRLVSVLSFRASVTVFRTTRCHQWIVSPYSARWEPQILHTLNGFCKKHLWISDRTSLTCSCTRRSVEGSKSHERTCWNEIDDYRNEDNCDMPVPVSCIHLKFRCCNWRECIRADLIETNLFHSAVNV